MFKVQDFNPVFKTSINCSSLQNSSIPGQPTNPNININPTNPIEGGTNASLNIHNFNFISNNISMSNANQTNLNNPSTPLSTNFGSLPMNQNFINDERLLTFTNYYKFCCLSNVNCYFYQFDTQNFKSSSMTGLTATSASTASSTSSQSTIGITYEVLQYEQLIKLKLKNDYQIDDIMTWIAKKELCVFQLKSESAKDHKDSDIDFNQLKDAMSNIISENNISLKLISASTFDSSKLFNNTLNGSPQCQLQKKSLNVIYLSFLRAVHKCILQKMTNSHSLFDASNQSLSIDIFPYSGHLITSSLIQRTVTTTFSNNENKKKKILKKLVPYFILKINPSLNQKNELIVNMTSLKKVFYKLTDYLTVSCNNEIQMLDENSSFVIYIAPSGIRCLIAGDTFADSITDEMPENHEKLFKVLKKFNDIDIVTNPALINGKRLWIKIHPSGFTSGNTGPVIADYLNSNLSTGKKFIFWPLELCFIQFASDCTPGRPQPESAGNEHFSIADPFTLVDEFIETMDEINQTKTENGRENKIEVKAEPAAEIKTDFKLPESFEFANNMENLDQQLKPLNSIEELHGFPEPMKTEDHFEDLFNDNCEPKFPAENTFQTNFDAEATNFHDADQSRNMDHLLITDKKIEDFDEDWDGLFGDSAEDEENKILENPVNSQPSGEKSDSEMYDIDQVIDNAIEDLENDIKMEERLAKEKEKEGVNREKATKEEDTKDSKDTNLNISSNQEETVKNPGSSGPLVTSLSGESSTSPFYHDPGAPSPIAFQIFTPETQSKKDQKFNNSEENSSSIPNHIDLTDMKKSIFSPLNFNPLIEKDIDSKYSNGGKFFVKKDILASDDLLDKNATQLKTPVLDTSNASFMQKMSFTTPSFNTHMSKKDPELDLKPVDDLLSDTDDEDNENSSGNNLISTEPNMEMMDSSVIYRPSDGKGDDMNIYDEEFGSGLLPSSNKKREWEGALQSVGFPDNDAASNTNLFTDIIDAANTESGAIDFSKTAFGSDFTRKLTHESSSVGLGIAAVPLESNPVKRRKLESIFDSIGKEEDDEIELDFEDDGDQDQNDKKLIPDILDFGMNTHESNAQSLVSFSSAHVDQNPNAIETIEIPNSWFYVLRLIAPIQIPFNFLALKSMVVSKQKVMTLLPILQEYVMFSQKYLNNQFLDMLVRNRECPSVLDTDVEYLLYKLFPGIDKVHCFELLESDTESREQKPYECLFGTHIPEQPVETKPKSDSMNKYYDDDGYSLFSPMNNGESQNPINELENIADDFKRLDIGDNIPENNLCRLKSPVVNVKRFNENIMINKIGLDYWRMLSLEPSSKKNFKALFVVPKSNTHFYRTAKVFYDSIIECYKDCKLGLIEPAKEMGIIEVEFEGKCTKEEYWNNAQQSLLSFVEEIQSQFKYETINNILLFFVDPFQDLESLVKMATVTSSFELALSEKSIVETDSKKKKKKKSKLFTRLPVLLFYKALSLDSFYMNEEGQFIVFTKEKYVDLCLELYNNCPNENSTALKDRKIVFTVEKEIQDSIQFGSTKKTLSRSLVENEVFLHLCYERSIDKKWCVASWVDQTGSINYTKSWFIDEVIEESKTFEKVADDIMAITTNYVSGFKKKTYVVLSRLNNIIPDDELAEWKRLSIKNNNILLIVMTAELESSTLMLSNNPGIIPTVKMKDEFVKDPGYTIASTASQSQTPANAMNNSSNIPYHVVGSSRFESPDVSFYTPSYDIGLSPMDVPMPQIQAPIQTLQPLHEEVISHISAPATPVLVDISDECYGLILQVAQPLSNQPRIPLKTGFLVNTGEGTIKNHVLEINLLSCQAGMSTTKFMKKLLVQYRNLGIIAPYLGMTGIERECGNVDFEEMFEEDEEDDYLFDDKWSAAPDGHSSMNLGQAGNEKSIKRKERLNIQHQYMQFHKMQLRQKRHKMREKEREGEKTEKNFKNNVIPVHMLAVRKLLDFLVNINVE